MKLTIKDDESKELKNKPENHVYEDIIKTIKIDIDYHKEKYNFLEKKIYYTSEILFGSKSTFIFSPLSVIVLVFQ